MILSSPGFYNQTYQLMPPFGSLFGKALSQLPLVEHSHLNQDLAEETHMCDTAELLFNLNKLVFMLFANRHENCPTFPEPNILGVAVRTPAQFL
ncbi:MAG: hypothetical protein DRI26_04560 [Chloroflexi bacterium]|nr:MAG: hypothetical protein DRI26_04560 [Chloroflexota bacterium]